MNIILPFPPSVNKYKVMFAGKMVTNPTFKKYYHELFLLSKAEKWTKFGDSAVNLHIDIHMINNRRFDMDNILKAIFDGLQYCQVFNDDSQVVKLVMNKIKHIKPVEKSNFIKATIVKSDLMTI